MKPIARWLAAALVTVASFAAVVWICGALILPSFMKDASIRWGVAGALGVAMAALAALWGHSFATGGQPADTASTGSPSATPKTATTGFRKYPQRDQWRDLPRAGDPGPGHLRAYLQCYHPAT